MFLYWHHINLNVVGVEIYTAQNILGQKRYLCLISALPWPCLEGLMGARDGAAHRVHTQAPITGQAVALICLRTPISVTPPCDSHSMESGFYSLSRGVLNNLGAWDRVRLTALDVGLLSDYSTSLLFHSVWQEARIPSPPTLVLNG